MNINRIRSTIMEEVEKDISDRLYNKSVSITDVQEYKKAVYQKVNEILKELKSFELK